MGGTYFPMFRDQIEANFSETAIAAWEQAAKSSVHAIPLIKRFAAVEGDTRKSDTKGQGRVSSVAFPRMGGVLHKAASKVKDSGCREVCSCADVPVRRLGRRVRC